jgi:hypothetical protein
MLAAFFSQAFSQGIKNSLKHDGWYGWHTSTENKIDPAIFSMGIIKISTYLTHYLMILGIETILHFY